MKQIIFIVALILGLTATAQDRTMILHKKDKDGKKELVHYITLTNTDSVKIEPEVANSIINGHEYVDLGLPSGLKWATCNVGANAPEELGDYYSWGEIATKTEYPQNNCATQGKSMEDISGNADYDAARAQWSATWRMPTKEEWEELINNCTWEWQSSDITDGKYKIIGPNGNYISLPASGYRWDTKTTGIGTYGQYWSSTPNGSAFTYVFEFQKTKYSINAYGTRSRGYSIRPVTN